VDPHHELLVASSGPRRLGRIMAGVRSTTGTRSESLHPSPKNEPGPSSVATNRRTLAFLNR